MKNLKKTVNVITLILLAITIWITQGSFIQTNKIKSLKDDRPAAENYANFCAGCHGQNLEKFAHKKWMNETTDSSAINSIKSGIEKIGMPSFRKTFTDTEIVALAAYVKKGIPEDRSKLKPAISPIVESSVQKFVVDTVVSGLNVPWGLAVMPNGDLLISERDGKLLLFSKGKFSAPIEGVPPLMAIGQGGLLDICLHPEYEKNGWIYFSYSALDKESKEIKGNTAIMRAKLNANKLTDIQVIFTGKPQTNRNYHFGCKLAFDNKGQLYFGIGDRGQHFDFAQKLDNTNGKIHRINDDGTIPKDNPFVDTKGALASIYSFGHRNPQGTCIDPVNGDIWETEHGPKGGDELNLIKPGLNYGWPEISYGINYDGTILTPYTRKEGMEQPVFLFVTIHCTMRNDLCNRQQVS
ncbi:MAG: PQQ-dependent sugar dehydrogenase [Bacteroidales bacterium]